MSKDLHHGGALDEMRGAFPDAPEPWLDLSTGINPWPYPLSEISEGSLKKLPMRAVELACKRALAAAIDAPEDSLLLAPGSELLIRLLPNVIHPKRVVVLSPSYGDHREVWRKAGSAVIEAADPLSYCDDADMMIVCNPNNPDGRRFDPVQLEMARLRLAARGGWLIIDEAYGDLEPAFSCAKRGGVGGLIILRSFGKFFGLAGVRLGALIAPPPILGAMQQLLGVWSVSGVALEIGERAYRDTAWQEEARDCLAAARGRLEKILETSGLTICGGTDLFCYAETENAHALWRRLAEKGIYVRRFAQSKNHLRFGLPPDEQAGKRLSAALKACRG